MTDMRATERLLEVVGEMNEATASVLTVIAGALVVGNNDLVRESLSTIQRCANTTDEAIAELRRRGDTLVRRDDLDLVVGQAISDASQIEGEWGISTDPVTDADLKWQAAIDNLLDAIGRKP